MTGGYLHNALRVVVRDTATGASTSGRYYADDEVNSALTRARTDAVQALFSIGDLLGFPQTAADYERSILGAAMPHKKARITLSGLLRSVAYTSPGQAVPNDFWKIECGVDSNGKFVKTEPVFQAEAMTNTWVRQVYAKGAAFYGALCMVYYWANPSILIGNNATDLNTGATALPDAFYHAIKFRAAAYLLLKERASHIERIGVCQRIYQKRLLSLK